MKYGYQPNDNATTPNLPSSGSNIQPPQTKTYFNNNIELFVEHLKKKLEDYMFRCQKIDDFYYGQSTAFEFIHDRLDYELRTFMKRHNKMPYRPIEEFVKYCIEQAGKDCDIFVENTFHGDIVKNFYTYTDFGAWIQECLKSFLKTRTNGTYSTDKEALENFESKIYTAINNKLTAEYELLDEETKGEYSYIVEYRKGRISILNEIKTLINTSLGEMIERYI